MKLISILGVAIVVFVTGCNTAIVRPGAIQPETQVMGHAAKGLAMKVSSSILWHYSGEANYEEMCTLPSGHYELVAVDRQFAYFKGPGTVSYSMRTGIRLSDADRKKGPGGIFIRRRGRSKMFDNCGAWIERSDGSIERVLAGYDSFLDKQGKSWKLIPK